MEVNVGQPVGGRVVIWDVHADYKIRGFDLRALIAGASLSDVSEMNALNGLTGNAGIGKRMRGWYVQGGYDVLASTPTEAQLIPYVRYESVNTQRSVATGFSIDPVNDQLVTSIGVAFKPIPQVVAKLGYQIHENEENTGTDQLNFQLGWLF
jgi:hypothetical protein